MLGKDIEWKEQEIGQDSPRIINFLYGSRKKFFWGNIGPISCSFYFTSLGPKEPK